MHRKEQTDGAPAIPGGHDNMLYVHGLYACHPDESGAAESEYANWPTGVSLAAADGSCKRFVFTKVWYDDAEEF